MVYSSEKPSMQLVGRRASAMIATPNRKSQKRMWMMLRVTISIFLIVTASVVSVMPILIIGTHHLYIEICVDESGLNLNKS